MLIPQTPNGQRNATSGFPFACHPGRWSRRGRGLRSAGTARGRVADARRGLLILYGQCSGCVVSLFKSSLPHLEVQCPHLQNTNSSMPEDPAIMNVLWKGESVKGTSPANAFLPREGEGALGGKEVL